jgi:hypothetical protein
VSGTLSRAARSSGQTTTNARPITLSCGTVPWFSSSMWKRESADEPRWSPITHRRPSGTSTPSAPGGQADSPVPAAQKTMRSSSKTYGSSSSTGASAPSGWTVTWPLVQQATRSPGTPMTRLMKSFSPGAPTPMAPLTARSTRCTPFAGGAISFSGVKESRPLKTTTSPREMSRKS